MARPKSEDKRKALMAAATRVIVAHGLSAATALIAQEAGVANGSLFTYFETKADLFNELYLELKSGMATAALKGIRPDADTRAQFFRAWSNWMSWAVAHPDARRALAQLGLSDEITPATRLAGHQAMAPIAQLMESARAHGPMRDVPIQFVGAIMNSLAEATMDFMVQEPKHAARHCKVGFEALWRMLT